MNQEKIGKFIKEIRKREHLSQQKFARKYGVTFQAVSKWENGKNIPDIAILKTMCEEYGMNLDDFLETKIPKRKKRYVLPLAISTVIAVAFFLALFAMQPKNAEHGFQFKTLSATCDNFNLYGSIAYDDKKSSIYITNITYCGEDELEQYETIKCELYENDGSTKQMIGAYDYDQKEPIDLEEFLKNVEFKIDNYERTCSVYENNSLYIEITAIKTDGTIFEHQIPLSPDENCNDKNST